MNLMVRTDGGSRGNPGPAAAGVVIQNEAGDFLFEGGFYLGRQTNNVAEYQGIIHALELAKKIGGTHLTILSDSQLLVKQLNGEYRVKNDTLRGYFDQANRLLREFKDVSIRHVYREENVDADAMVNQALDAQADVGGFAEPEIHSSPEKSSSAAETKNKISLWNLAAEIQFDPKHPVQKRLFSSGKLAMELVCLDHKQKWEKPASQEIFVLLYEGQGCMEIDSRKKNVSKGDCFLSSAAEKAVFQADREPMILLITGIESPKIKSPTRRSPRLF